ncbi:uncharacterized protein LACBIDRAFT_310316 [Laccaria bicolor S238N-H82]|uniref:Predicted protein n=1 Tax=Laccaria bicolor (strain S238N-H82 / ATCC MYA-4686) TaxID=486041 RepID=B0DU37_LACBS|nr:uncharacterized protein LACBIDRAFT_310316 [Laccaria bicolor S238N-H82]EDR01880.1 predicted protein [Laccaria bicolor S238N-H82]|eukprot:XP_001887490.1 predicted protein [Laccaria bicolor S238N-H82]
MPHDGLVRFRTQQHHPIIGGYSRKGKLLSFEKQQAFRLGPTPNLFVQSQPPSPSNNLLLDACQLCSRKRKGTDAPSSIHCATSDSTNHRTSPCRQSDNATSLIFSDVQLFKLNPTACRKPIGPDGPDVYPHQSRLCNCRR